ncbi:MAG: hypothetical protein KJ749_02940 [Planctomycetes bacterium]|nr:hypothetical protein [Planctomycetota bacterium]
MIDRQRIVESSFALMAAVSRFAARARAFFYEVMLSDHTCPTCDGPLTMQGEGRCRCQACRQVVDPTLTFQACPRCGAKPRLRLRRYECSACGAEIVSHFLFDGLVFDADYFRRKMGEHRQRRAEQRERVRQMLAENRSGVLTPPAADLGAVPGLADALNRLTGGMKTPLAYLPCDGFDLNRYQAHIRAHIRPFAMSLDEIPPLGENARNDRVWRFITIIFLAHARIIEIWQDGQTVMLKQYETNREGPHVPGDVEEIDGVEGLVGRVET